MIKKNQGESKKKVIKANRSRSRSLSLQKSKDQINGRPTKKLALQSSKGKLKKSILNPSLSKSQSKRTLNKSVSQQKLNRSSSQSRVVNTLNKSLDKKGSKGLIKQAVKDKKQVKKEKVQAKESKPVVQEMPNSTVKSDERQMGLIFVRPQHDKIVFKGLDITDGVFDKYLQMINNDNDANYVMNALPELRTYQKEDESEGRDFVSGRISRLSGVFQNLSVDKIITPIKKVPNYYSGQCGKNLTLLRIMLQTKFKVEVDVGFLEYSLDGDKLTVFRIYVSKIYRRMNYVGYIYLESLRALMARHPGADRWSIFILQKNANVHKFFKFLGFHIDKVATESKNRSVDYFQEFVIKKKELNTVLSSMAK